MEEMKKENEAESLDGGYWIAKVGSVEDNTPIGETTSVLINRWKEKKGGSHQATRCYSSDGWCQDPSKKDPPEPSPIKGTD
jgi:hypothetical protein